MDDELTRGAGRFCAPEVQIELRGFEVRPIKVQDEFKKYRTRETNQTSNCGRTANKRGIFSSPISRLIASSDVDQPECLRGPPSSRWQQSRSPQRVSTRSKRPARSFKINSRLHKTTTTLLKQQIASALLLAILLSGSIPSWPHQSQCKSAGSTTSQYVVAASLLVGPKLGTARADLDDDLVAAEAAYSTTSSFSGRSQDDDEMQPATVAGPKRARSGANSRRDLIEFLESLPISSVGQKHTALFECDLDEDTTKATNFKLVWLKLVRNTTTASQQQQQSRPQPGDSDQSFNDITLLSIGKRTISPDKRFKVQHQPPSKWTLAIENVNLNDDKAYYLCQVGGQSTAKSASNPARSSSASNRIEQHEEPTASAGLNFVGGARLNVLVPPKIVETDTSPNLVQVDEFSALRLQCKVISEPQAQISWRREDGKSLDGPEQRFKHLIDRRPHRVVSIDSGELLFNSIRRDQAGAYLCIASNGVQPGVSQRISVAIGNCRQSGEPDAKAEPCNQPERANSANDDDDDDRNGAASTSKPTARRPQQQSSWPPRRANSTGSGGVRTAGTNGGQPDNDQTRRAQQQPSGSFRTAGNQTDKTRGSRYNQNRRANQANQQRRLLETDSSSSSSNSSGSSSSFQYSISATCLTLAGFVYSAMLSIITLAVV